VGTVKLKLGANQLGFLGSVSTTREAVDVFRESKSSGAVSKDLRGLATVSSSCTFLINVSINFHFNRNEDNLPFSVQFQKKSDLEGYFPQEAETDGEEAHPGKDDFLNFPDKRILMLRL